MRSERITKTLRELVADNRLMKITNAVAMLVILILGISVVSKKTTVVMQPPPLADQASIGPNQASPEMYKAWGLHIANILGNVNPDTAGFVVEAISPILTARMYQPVRDAVKEQATKLSRERISISFTPNGVDYDPNEHVVTVYGELTTRGLRDAVQRENTSYRMHLVVVNYRVLLDELDVF